MIIIYGLAFIILWEWLRPLVVITDTGNLYVFILFTLFCFVLMYLRIASFISIPLIFISIMFGLHHIFFEGSFIREGFSTLTWFGADLARNIQFLISNKMDLLSFEFRSFLLFLVLSITSYLVHYWLYHVKKIFFFLLVTVIYVTVLDTFTVYDASNAIIRLVVAGFLLMTLLYKMRLEEKEQIKGNELGGKAWMNFVLLTIASVVAIAFFSPKYEPQWPDPLPMVKGVVSGDQGTAGATQTIGYSANDENLGGGFENDDTVVFTAISNQGHYWRGESKEVYTGKGWDTIEHELNRTFRYSESYESDVSVQLYEQNVQFNTEEVTISMVDEQPFWHFFYPGELLEVDEEKLIFSSQSEEPFHYLIDYVSGKVGAVNRESGDGVLLQEYTLTYHNPTFVIEQLKNSSESDPLHIQQVYLQLPELPGRIGQLANDITESYDNRYDKVKAIESYFSKNNYRYETTDVAVPTKEQDYVDQFLFETRQGYCDNFSTSMVVMLRTLDIPARWVKGFTQGTEVEKMEDGKKKFEVSNANAHSWVEVYFPNVGWVSFEPTKGFTNNFEFTEEVELETDEVGSSNTDQEDGKEETPKRERDPENPFLPLKKEKEINSVTGDASVETNSLLEAFPFLFKWIGIFVAFALVVFLFYKNYQKLLTLLFSYTLRNSSDQNSFMKSYRRLLWLLELNGYKRLNNETLREYAQRIDHLFSTEEMHRLTNQYEKLYYGRAKEELISKEMNASWEQLIKKMSS